jgi:uncharacterized protein YukE
MQEHYDTDSLRTAGGAFSSHSQDLASALHRLRGSLPNITSMSGDDDPGHQFAAKFKPAADKLNQFLTDMAGGLDSAGQGLRTMAANLDGADNHSTVPGR